MTRRSAWVAAAVLLAACSETPYPTGLHPATAAYSDSGTGAGATIPAALIPVEDALNRILEVLPEHPAKEELRGALAELSEAIKADDSCAIRTSRRTAEHALRDLSRRQPAEYEADFEVVKLALGTVEQSGRGRC